MTDVALDSPALQSEATDLLHAAQAITVTDSASFGRAVEMVKFVKTFLRRVDEATEPVISAAHASWKAALRQKEQFIGQAGQAELVLKQRMATYEQAQARLRREAEDVARRERERLEAEEHARVAAERARLLREAEDIRLSEAVAAAERGDVQAAEKLLTAPVVTPTVAPRPVFVPPVAVQTVPQMMMKGVSFSEQWAADVESLMDLVQAIAKGQTPITLVEPNIVVLNQMARALKKAMNVPGVRAVSKRITSVRA